MSLNTGYLLSSNNFKSSGIFQKRTAITKELGFSFLPNAQLFLWLIGTRSLQSCPTTLLMDKTFLLYILFRHEPLRCLSFYSSVFQARGSGRQDRSSILGELNSPLDTRPGITSPVSMPAHSPTGIGFNPKLFFKLCFLCESSI